MTFIETIKIERGEIALFELHRERMAETARAHDFEAPIISVKELLDGCSIDHKRVKCRIEYSRQGVLSIDYSPYELRDIKSLKVICDDDIEYSFKYGDRSELDTLRAQRGECDDIIIVKNGVVAECSYANLVFVKDGKYFTPKSCLLNGTRRRDLLSTQIIEEREIVASEIQNYDSVMLINGMIELGEVCVDCRKGIFGYSAYYY